MMLFFYISANPFCTALEQNVADISSKHQFHQKQWLRKWGSLATLIVKNFKRVKENSFADSNHFNASYLKTTNAAKFF
jgi:hypothetical protein